MNNIRIVEYNYFLQLAIRRRLPPSGTYFIIGWLISTILKYGEVFQQEIIWNCKQPIDSSYVKEIRFIQTQHGHLFAFGIWPIRELIFDDKHSWLFCGKRLLKLEII